MIDEQKRYIPIVRLANMLSHEDVKKINEGIKKYWDNGMLVVGNGVSDIGFLDLFEGKIIKFNESEIGKL